MQTSSFRTFFRLVLGGRKSTDNNKNKDNNKNNSRFMIDVAYEHLGSKINVPLENEWRRYLEKNK